MKTIVNIPASIVLQALRNAKPVTAVGRSAVENFRGWMVNNTLCATALENAIVSLTGKSYDPGLESLIATLKGLMPESKRKVAVAYEQMQMQLPGTIFSANTAAYESLITLFNANASKIVDSINDGALDAFKTNPVIANLIGWAKSAYDSAPEQTRLSAGKAGNVNFTLEPVLNLAAVGEDMLVSIDKRTFLLGKSGKLTYVPDASSITELPNDVRALMSCIGMMHVSPTEANVLLFDDEVLNVIRKALPIRRLGVNLIGGIDSIVVMNDESMSVDKAIAMLTANTDDMIAAVLASNAAVPEAIKIIRTAFDMFEKYRGIVNSNMYANKFSIDANAVYMLDAGNRIAVVQQINGTIVDCKSYNTMFDALASEVFIANPALYDTAAAAFANELKSDAKKMSIRQQIATNLTKERKEYENLLDRIDSEISELEQNPDANPDKLAALQALKQKSAEKIATIAEELDKLAKA